VPDTVESRTLQALCAQRRHVVDERVALTNRLTSLLEKYLLQVLELASRQS
jgi:transposase